MRAGWTSAILSSSATHLHLHLLFPGPHPDRARVRLAVERHRMVPDGARKPGQAWRILRAASCRYLSVQGRGARPRTEYDPAGADRQSAPRSLHSGGVRFRSRHAHRIIASEVQTGTKVKIHTVVAGPPERNSEKVHNLTAAVLAIPEKFDVLVFRRFRHPPGTCNWLTKLVTPPRRSAGGSAGGQHLSLADSHAARRQVARLPGPWRRHGMLRW